MRNPPFTCRRAEPEDAAEIALIHVSSWHSAYRGLLPDELLAGLSIDVRRSGWTQILNVSDPRSITIVVEHEGQIVGFCHAGQAREVDPSLNWGEIFAIYTLEGFWGQGVGRILMAESLQFLEDSKYDKVQLWVLYGNERAMEFYEKAGFELDNTLDGMKLEQFGEATVREYRYLKEWAGGDSISA